MTGENRLFGGNLSCQTRANDLTDVFSQAGAVASVNLEFDKFNGKSPGFAFVEFASAREAAKRSRCSTTSNSEAGP